MNTDTLFSESEKHLLAEACGAERLEVLYHAINTQPAECREACCEIEAALASELAAQLDENGKMSSYGLELEEILVKIVQFQASQSE